MAVVGVPLINGVEYTHADIVCNILGIPVVGITAINYSDPQTITLNHGTGTLPVSRGFGPVQPQASITMMMKEVQRLSNAAPGGRIQNIPDFDIGVNFITEAGDFVRHRLIRVRFTGRNPNSEVNNSMIAEELQLSVVDIDYNA
jgi:hypothetical protein